MSLSHRSSTVLFLGMGVVGLRLAMSGKIGKAWAAWSGPSTKPGTTTPTTGSGGGGGTTQIPSGTGNSSASGYPSASLFGLSGITSFLEGTGVPGVAAQDTAGLTYAAGHYDPVAHDLDYSGPTVANQQVRAPIGGTIAVAPYQPTGSTGGQIGWLVAIKDLAGNIYELLHLGSIAPGLTAGKNIPAGTYIGTVGAGPYDPANWTGPHLAVIADQGAYTDLMGASGGQ